MMETEDNERKKGHPPTPPHPTPPHTPIDDGVYVHYLYSVDCTDTHSIKKRREKEIQLNKENRKKRGGVYPIVISLVMY